MAQATQTKVTQDVKVIQLQALPVPADQRGGYHLYALCDDGTLWAMNQGVSGDKWIQIEPPPVNPPLPDNKA